MQLNAPDDRRLAGRVAVVTGAAKEHGIGRAFFLACPDSDFMTCRTILVEGGGSMW